MDVLCPLRDQVGESPLWSPAEEALWWVDIEGRALHRFDWAALTWRSWAAAERIGSMALHAGGGLLGAMETGLFHLRPNDDGRLDATPLAAVDHPREGMRFNDGRCDRAGRFWAGTMLRDMAQAAAVGSLYRLDAARGLKAVLGDLIVPNGLGFAPDNRTMYLSDSHPSMQRIWSLDLDTDGTLRRRREFVDMNQDPGRPDGAAVDADGGYWICANDAGLVHRFMPDGGLDRSIAVPVSKPSMCAFGGPGLEWMFITSIRPAVPPRGEEALAGAVFVVRPGVTGLAETPFQP